MNKIEIGKPYRNICTKKVCIVTQKIFHNIQYEYPDDLYKRAHCIHYKRFKKCWEEI